MAGPPRDVAATVANSDDVQSAQRVLQREHLIRVQGGRSLPELRIFHSALRSAVYETLSPTARLAMHRNAAAVVVDAGSRLQHLVAASEGNDVDALVAQLVDYAKGRHLEQRYRDASKYFGLAARVAGSSADRRRLLLHALTEGVLGGDRDSVRLDVEVGDAAERLLVAVSLIGEGQAARARQVLAGIADDELVREPDELQYRIRVVRAWTTAMSGRPAPEALADLDLAAGLPKDPAFAVHHEWARIIALGATADQREYRSLIGEDRDRNELTTTPAGLAVLSWRALARSLQGRLQESIRDTATAIDYASDGVMTLDSGTYSAGQAFAHFLAGDPARASANLEIARASRSADRWLATSVSSLRRYFGGDPAESRGYSQSARQAIFLNRFVPALETTDQIDVVALMLTGSDDERAEWLTARINDFGEFEPSSRGNTPWLAYAAYGLAAGWGSHPETALRWAQLLGQSEYPPLWLPAMVRWLEARAAAAAEGADVTGILVELSRDGFASLPLFELLVARDAVSMAARHGHPELPEILAHANTLALEFNTRGGTIPLLAGADFIAESTPAREVERLVPDAPIAGSSTAVSPAMTDDVFAALSERERAVVALVVRGLSYAQIADELFVTRSTVSFHLTRCYAKTNTRSRHELANLARSAMQGQLV